MTTGWPSQEQTGCPCPPCPFCPDHAQYSPVLQALLAPPRQRPAAIGRLLAGMVEGAAAGAGARPQLLRCRCSRAGGQARGPVSRHSRAHCCQQAACTFRQWATGQHSASTEHRASSESRQQHEAAWLTLLAHTHAAGKADGGRRLASCEVATQRAAFRCTAAAATPTPRQRLRDGRAARRGWQHSCLINCRQVSSPLLLQCWRRADVPALLPRSRLIHAACQAKGNLRGTVPCTPSCKPPLCSRGVHCGKPQHCS